MGNFVELNSRKLDTTSCELISEKVDYIFA